MLAAENVDESLPLRVPRKLEYRRLDRIGAAAPFACPVWTTEVQRDLRQAVASGPAHHRRRGMHSAARAQLPDPRVGLVVQRERALTQPFQAQEIVDARRMQQSAIEECLRGREDSVAVDVVLSVLVSLVADADRPHAAIAGQGVDEALDDFAFQADAIQGLQMALQGRSVGAVSYTHLTLPTS